MDTAPLQQALQTLIKEIYIAAPDPKQTWAVSNTPGSGLLGTLDALSPQQASRASGDSHSIASHARHALFAIDSGLRYAAGDFAERNWDASWGNAVIDAQEWQLLRQNLRSHVEQLINLTTTENALSDAMNLTGVIGLIAHGAYHLGIIRHLCGQVRTL